MVLRIHRGGRRGGSERECDLNFKNGRERVWFEILDVVGRWKKRVERGRGMTWQGER